MPVPGLWGILLVSKAGLSFFAGIWMMDADQEVHHRRYLLARFPIANVTFIAA
jgi:hypothetical protein